MTFTRTNNDNAKSKTDWNSLVNRSSLFCRLLTATLLMTSTLPVSAAHTSDKAFQAGIASGNHMQWQQSADQFTAVLKRDPSKTDCYRKRALCYAQAHDYEACIADLSKVISIDSDPEALLLRGNMFKKQGLDSQAMDDYNSVISHLSFDTYIKTSDPQGILGEAYFNRGELLVQTARYPEAAIDFRTALGFKPELKAVIEQYETVMPGIADSTERGAICMDSVRRSSYGEATTAPTAKIGQLEIKYFARPFESEQLTERLTRLERFLFGTADDTKTLPQRIARLPG